MASLAAVAEVAGVSIRTVGRAIHQTGYVDARVRERVLVAAKQLGYRPNRVARALRTGRSHEVLALAAEAPSQQDELHIAKVAGMERALRAHELSLSLLFSLEGEARRLGHDVLDELIARQPLGVALFPSPRLLLKDAARRLAQAGLPYVVLDPPDAGVDQVRHDRAQGVHEAVLHLAERGRRRIAYLGPEGERTRLDGYERALGELGREPTIVSIPAASWENGRAAVAQLLALTPRPDAVQVFSDIVALGVLAGLHERGVRVPEEVAVVGFDDRLSASLSWPPLTTVRQDNLALGAAAAEMLLAKARGAAAPEGGWTTVVPTSLVVRSST